MQIECFIIIGDVEMFWFCFDMILIENTGMLGNQVWKSFQDHVAYVISLIRLMTSDPGCKVKNTRNISVGES